MEVEALFEEAKGQLTRANADRRHPFRQCVLSTMDHETGNPTSRMVICRKVSQDFHIAIYTDARTPKVSDIRGNSGVSLLFWHPTKKLQIRMSGTAGLADRDSEIHRQSLRSVKGSFSVSDYNSTRPPGSDTDGEVERGETLHLAVITVAPQKIDILKLSREGHSRLKGKYVSNEWRIREVIP